ELPKRKPTRLKGYDYSQSGAYFITICTKERKELLSKIIVGDGVLDVPENILSEYGKIADKHINQMNVFYDILSVDKYVIMTNHIHLIINVSADNDIKQCGMSGTPSPTNALIARFVSTLKRFCNKEYGFNIWQRSFHDHIIRDKDDYDKIWEYIDSNTLKWKQDCFYCD
ncbi:MAG: transposase, partial [Clostridia bacterium]|nr:transposase [Clostridia bacterium]